jgi:hypothetical protein
MAVSRAKTATSSFMDGLRLLGLIARDQVPTNGAEALRAVRTPSVVIVVEAECGELER